MLKEGILKRKRNYTTNTLMGKRYFNIVWVVIFLIGFLFVRPLREGIDYVPGEILIQYRKDTSDLQIRSFHKSHGLKVVKTFFATHQKKEKVYHLKLKRGVSVEQAIEEYKKHPNVEIVQPNYIYYLNYSLPNDTSFYYLWGFHNIGQRVNGVSGSQASVFSLLFCASWKVCGYHRKSRIGHRRY